MSATDSNPVILYDIPGKGESRSWSPNVWKIRLILNYKRIPYRTEWISYPDIASIFKSVGIQPTGIVNNGDPLYTVPAIIDPTPNGPIFVSDSNRIAIYLDETYGDELKHSPRLFPEGSRQAQLDFCKKISEPFGEAWIELIIPSVPRMIADPRGSEYYVRTRKEYHGIDLNKLGNDLTGRHHAWDEVKKGLDNIAAAYDQNVQGGGEYFMGQQISYVDVVLLSKFLFGKYVTSNGDDGSNSFWDCIKGLNGGKWERMMARSSDYIQVQ